MNTKLQFQNCTSCQQFIELSNIDHPQTKFGARSCFHICMLVILSKRGSLYDLTSCLSARSHVPSGKGVSVPGPMLLWGIAVPGGLCPGGSLKELKFIARAKMWNP